MEFKLSARHREAAAAASGPGCSAGGGAAGRCEGREARVRGFESRPVPPAAAAQCGGTGDRAEEPRQPLTAGAGRGRR